MKVFDLFCKILNDFEHEGNSTIIKAVEKQFIIVFLGVEIKYDSVTINIAEYIKELSKHGFTVDDDETSSVLYHLIRYFWAHTDEIILDFENVLDVLNPYEELYKIIDTLERLSYEHGRLLKEQVKVINVPKQKCDYNTYIENAMSAYKHNLIVYKEEWLPPSLIEVRASCFIE